MYPFLQLEDGTEIVHSEIILENETEHVKVYIEKPIEGGFKSAFCYLLEYKWDEVEGFDAEEIAKLQEIIESTYSTSYNSFCKAGRNRECRKFLK